MRECTVCGLTFLSGEICPGCGSNIHNQVVSEEQGDSETETKIPGMDAFLETSSDVISEVVEEEVRLGDPLTPEEDELPTSQPIE